MRRLLLSIVLMISLSSLPVSGDVPMDILHMFEGGPDDGAKPYGSLTLVSDGRLYGMTSAGGIFSLGVIFSINPNGSDYGVLYHFGSTPSDGSLPRGSLTETNGRLYGVTSEGGTFSLGVIFGIDPDGSDYDVLYHFGSTPNDGSTPFGSLTFVDSVLCGMTSAGGTAAGGTIFSIKPDGSDYNLLHHFGSIPDDGITPFGSVTYIDSILWGLTSAGGTAAGGTIFSIKPDGSDYNVDYNFGVTFGDGVHSIGSLTLGSDGKLFGFTGDGGGVPCDDYGTFFSFPPEEPGPFKWPTWLHNYCGAPDDGSSPSGSPTEANGAWYGTTREGGNYSYGIIFKSNPDGSNYDVLYNFAGAPNDGSSPFGSLTYVDDFLCGMTSMGGSYDVGVIFSIEALVTGAKDFVAPKIFRLYQNVPNPFNPTTRIGFSLDQEGDVSLVIYDITGKVVKKLLNQWATDGAYSQEWNGRDEQGNQVSSGVYFYRLTAGNRTLTKKMVLLK